MNITPESGHAKNQITTDADHIMAAAPSRSLLMLGAGAILGLLLAGYGLFTASGSSTNTLPAGTLALVNQKQILISDFNAQFMVEFETTPEQGTAEQRKKVLNEMIREELLVQRGLEMDLPATDPDVRAALVEGVNVVNEAEQQAQKFDEETLRNHYRQNQDKYMTFGAMAVRDLQMSTYQGMQQANELVTLLRKGARVESLASKFGFKLTELAEQIDPAIKKILGDQLFEAASKLKQGEISDPITLDSDRGHVLIMVKRKLPTPTPFEVVKDIVSRDIKAEALKKTTDQQLENLRGKAEIILTPGYEK